MLHPLRAANREYYEQVLAKLKRLGDKAKTKGARKQRLYRQRRVAVESALVGIEGDFKLKYSMIRAMASMLRGIGLIIT